MADQPEVPDLEVEFKSPSGLKVTTERPYRVLLVADYGGSEKGTLSGDLAKGVVEVRPESFDEVMKAAAPTINYTTTDPLLPGNVMVELNLRFTSLKEFDPKALAQQIPATVALLAAREKVVERMRGKISADALKAAAAGMAQREPGLAFLSESLAWTPAHAASPDAVDSLLGGIDLGDGAASTAPPPKSAIGSLVSAAAGGGGGVSIPGEEASAARRTLAEIDRRITSWLNAVLHAPSVQNCEASWRSLAFLISQCDFRKGLRVHTLHARRDDLSQRFITQLIDPVFDAGADAPDLVVLNMEFDNTAPHMELLDEMAQHGASIPAVVFAGVSPSFFGVKQSWQMTSLPPVLSLFDQWQFAKWKSLRGQPYARSLGVFFGRSLLRGPHGETSPPGDLDFHFKEDAITEKDFVWTTGPVAAACAVAASVNKSGWPTAMTGYVHGRVEGFAVAEGGKNKDKKFGPTDTMIPEEKIQEIAAAGVNLAVGIKDHNDCILWNGLSAARPQRMDVDAFQEISLPYQLFAGRLSNLLFALKPFLTGVPKDKLVPFVLSHVRDWVKIEGEPADEQQVAVETRAAEDNPALTELAVIVTPPQSVLPGGIPVVLGYRLQ